MEKISPNKQTLKYLLEKNVCLIVKHLPIYILKFMWRYGILIRRRQFAKSWFKLIELVLFKSPTGRRY